MFLWLMAWDCITYQGACCWRRQILSIALHLGMGSFMTMCQLATSYISLFRQPHCWGIIRVTSLSCIKDTTMQHTLWLLVSSGMFPEPYVQGCVIDLWVGLGVRVVLQIYHWSWTARTQAFLCFHQFCVLQLYWKCLLNLSFLLESIESFKYWIMSFANRGNFPSFLFLSLLYPVLSNALTKTLSTIVNKDEDSCYPCLPDFRSVFHPNPQFCMTMTVGFQI